MPGYVSTSTYATTTDNTWVTWATSTSTSATSTVGVWTYWVDSTTTTTTSTIAPSYRPQRHRQLTAAELEQGRLRAEADQLARAQRAAELRKQQQRASRKATVLLMRNLTPEQRESYKLHKMFEVVARSGQRYKITKGRVGNVHVLDDQGRTRHRLCAHPNVLCPDEDTMLSQKLMLEHLEQEFVRTANVHRH